MDINKPMSLLLIEDDKLECDIFKSYVNSRDDVRFVGVTNSSTEGLKYVKTHMPEGVIVDLELHNGEGSGLTFLTELKKLSIDFKPLVIVTTNVASNTVYSYAHTNGADLVFFKKQKDYSVEMIINTFLLLRKTLHSNRSNIEKEIANIETPEEYRVRITEKINAELDLIGISSHLKGRKYFYDAIYYLIQENDKSRNNESVFYYLSNLYKRAYSSITRAMQTSINHAWKISAIEDLQMHYTAKINYSTGIPTPTEFVYYYADKIRKFL